jgi:hypothetical protein
LGSWALWLGRLGKFWPAEAWADWGLSPAGWAWLGQLKAPRPPAKIPWLKLPWPLGPPLGWLGWLGPGLGWLVG